MVRLTVSTLLCSSIGWSACSLDVRLLYAVTTLFVFPDVNHAAGFVQRSVWYVSRRTVAGRWGRRLVRRTVGTFSIRRAVDTLVSSSNVWYAACFVGLTVIYLVRQMVGSVCASSCGRSCLFRRSLCTFPGSLDGWWGARFVNSSHSWISMHILHTFLRKFIMVLTRRICLTIKSFFSWWSFPLFS